MPLSTFMSVVLSQFVCIPWVKRPFINLEDPASHGMNNTENFRIQVKEGEDIGAWFVHPPKNLESNAGEECLARNVESTNPDGGSSCPDTQTQENSFVVGHDQVVVLYLHGNAETRSQSHRAELYKVFQRLNYHVLAIDYRGYADSFFLWTPNEKTMVEDALSAYNWLRERTHPNAKVIVWGHSLGSGVTAKFGSFLSSSDLLRPFCYILESPFSSLLDEIKSFYVSVLLPFDIANQLRLANLEFDSNSNLKKIKEPVLILHAKDDKVVPFELGKKLFDENKDSGDVTFKDYDADLKLGHTDIFLAKELPETIDNFIHRANRP